MLITFLVLGLNPKTPSLHTHSEPVHHTRLSAICQPCLIMKPSLKLPERWLSVLQSCKALRRSSLDRDRGAHRSPHPPKEEGFKRVVMCSGKVYYELAKKRAEEKKEKEVAIIRLEQVSHPCCAQPVQLATYLYIP